MRQTSHDWKAPKNDPPAVYSSEKALMDYITVKGIQRIGIEKSKLYLFVLKELLDNALDFLESNGCRRNEDEPIVKVDITDSKFIVSNSNFGRQSFTKDRLNSIFTIDTFVSSKRNIYRISRGHLGDALKSVIGIPYALATDYEIENWDKPMVIREGKFSFLIRLNIDRVSQSIRPDIEMTETPTHDIGFTNIEVTFPEKKNMNYYPLDLFLRDYARLNPHITFHIDITQKGAAQRYYLLQTQGLNPEWSNHPRISYYSLSEFQQLIYGIENNDALTYDVLRALNFREATNISRKNAALTIRELKEDSKKISELYSMLTSLTTVSAITKLKTQFDSNREIRKAALKKRLEQLGYNVTGIKYRIVNDYVNYNGSIRFPFIFEIAILHTSNASASYTVYGINSSARYDHPFQGKYYGTYIWETSRGKQQEASSIEEILVKYGYSKDKDKAKKTTSIIIVNLISPRIDYEGYNKQIDLTPFADTIANTTYRIASESTTGGGMRSERVTGIGTLTEILTERDAATTGNDDLLRTGRWTQSTPYYLTRKRLKNRNGPEVTRKYITGKIKEVCLKEFNKTREELGIFAADRAQMYFRGQWHDVGFEEISELKKKGTDLLVIEKENVAEVLGPFADDYGIALLNSRGFLVDYAVKLSELSGGNIAILTDFDDSGLLMAKKVPSILRIGIDNKTLRYFKLPREDLEEAYDEDHNKNHYLKLEELAKTDAELKAMLPYVRDTRVEIDSVLAVVGNERFWKFVLKKLNEFPTRNYNRAIEIPKDVIPQEIEDFLTALKKKCNSAAEDQRDEMEAQLEEVNGFIDDIGDKEEGIIEQIRNVVSENEDIKALVADIQTLVDKYPFLRGNSTEGGI